MKVIRHAHLTDLPRIVDLAREEHRLSQFARYPFDAEFTRGVARGFIELMGRTMLVSDGGYLAGMVQPIGFSAQRIAIEFAWYAKDGSGMALLARFENWAARMGAVSVVVHDQRMKESRLLRVLKRKGYDHMGTAVMKRIGV